MESVSTSWKRNKTRLCVAFETLFKILAAKRGLPDLVVSNICSFAALPRILSPIEDEINWEQPAAEADEDADEDLQNEDGVEDGDGDLNRRLLRTRDSDDLYYGRQT